MNNHYTDFIIRRHYFAANVEFAILQLTDMQYIAIVDLNVCDFERSSVCLGNLTVNDNAPIVIFLATSFGVEISTIEQKTKDGVLGKVGRRVDEALVVEDGFHFRGDMAKFWANSVSEP
jgi:hypothetical protein